MRKGTEWRHCCSKWWRRPNGCRDGFPDVCAKGVYSGVELPWFDLLLDSIRLPGFVSGFWNGLLTYCGVWPIKCRQGRSKTNESDCRFWEKLTFDWLVDNSSQDLFGQRPQYGSNGGSRDISTAIWLWRSGVLALHAVATPVKSVGSDPSSKHISFTTLLPHHRPS
jgi:hypothetical protein